MKFKHALVIVLGNDVELLKAAQSYLPLNERYAAAKQSDVFVCFTSSPKRTADPQAKFTKLNVNCLHKFGAPTFEDKLFIFAHADQNKVDVYGPKELADALHGWGLKTIGLITFKACNVGSGNFLDDLKTAFSSAEIQAAWLKGYRGYSSTVVALGASGSTKMTENVRETDDKYADLLLGDNRYRVVQGNFIKVVEGAKRYGWTPPKAFG